jgi:hypothetical protein
VGFDQPSNGCTKRASANIQPIKQRRRGRGRDRRTDTPSRSKEPAARHLVDVAIAAVVLALARRHPLRRWVPRLTHRRRLGTADHRAATCHGPMATSPSLSGHLQSRSPPRIEEPMRALQPAALQVI